jgi:hypothetical protein
MHEDRPGVNRRATAVTVPVTVTAYAYANSG